jgi:hypothetical protein
MRLKHYSFVSLGLLLGLASCMGSQSATETLVSKAPPRSASARDRLPVAVDVPQLIGLNIDELRKMLGPAYESTSEKMGLEPTAEQLKATKGEGWVNTFDYHGRTLVVTFHALTRKVRDIVLIGSNEDELLQVGHLSLTASNYIVLPVPDSQSTTQISGLRVVGRK